MSEHESLFAGGYCMCDAVDCETGETGWRPCPTSLCERPDHDHGEDDAA